MRTARFFAGKYFPITTFRRLIAHTRLTFLFLQSGSQLFREPPSVEDRKPISTPLVTGVKPLDVLTPIGRGQCLLLTGEVGTNLSQLGINAIVAQTEMNANKNVRCVFPVYHVPPTDCLTQD